ncbi:MAG: hypothetical protein JWP27_1859 [Flaviaesturariibacter sp.]|nr:hypothetical protein [Flaviaesturariibacter sp.]
MRKDKYRGRDAIYTATMVLLGLLAIAVALLFILKN